MGFGNTLQELRQAARMSQVELARRSETPIDTLRKWEQGRTLPGIDAAAKLAKALGVSLDRLATDDRTSSQGQVGSAPKKARSRPPKATPSTPPADELEATAKKPRGRRERGSNE
jgi:transcriptional regulator with XRE-family HTH domain